MTWYNLKNVAKEIALAFAIPIGICIPPLGIFFLLLALPKRGRGGS